MDQRRRALFRGQGGLRKLRGYLAPGGGAKQSDEDNELMHSRL